MSALNLGVFDYGHIKLMRKCGFSQKTHRFSHFKNGTQRSPVVQSYSLKVEETSRRSGNYHPSIWSHDLIESIQSPYTDVEFNTRIDELKLDVKLLLGTLKEPLTKLELINSIMRLGLACHFEEEIKKELDQLYVNGFEGLSSLHETSLCFRLLRQHGYTVSSNVFQKFKDENKGFKGCLGQDAKGLLSLYEASYLAIPHEKILEEALEFSVGHLNHLKEKMDFNFAEQVEHSLEMPLHWRMPRLEARHYIDVYEREDGRSSSLLELAKLDFNVTQCIHQMEMKKLSRWWKDLGLGEKLKFSRDRLLELYLWAMEIASEPQYSDCRMQITKIFSMVTVIDDIYDVYGSLEELQHFTTSVKSFNLGVMENLPDYMKLTILALFNFVNETAYYFLKDHGLDVMPFIKNEWCRLCEGYLQEATWFDKAYKPTLKEFMENAWITVGGPVSLLHAYFLIRNTFTSNSYSHIEEANELIYWSSSIIRFNDDLGTSKAEMERGDNPKSIQCHMNDSGNSEETAGDYIKGLVSDCWRNLNMESVQTSLPRSFVKMALNTARVAQCIYHHGDGIGTSTGGTESWITSLFIDDIPIK